MTVELTHLIRKKKQVYKRAKLYKRDSDWSEYKDLQRRECQVLKQKHRAIILTLFHPQMTTNFSGDILKLNNKILQELLP